MKLLGLIVGILVSINVFAQDGDPVTVNVELMEMEHYVVHHDYFDDVTYAGAHGYCRRKGFRFASSYTTLPIKVAPAVAIDRNGDVLKVYGVSEEKRFTIYEEIECEN